MHIFLIVSRLALPLLLLVWLIVAFLIAVTGAVVALPVVSMRRWSHQALSG